MYRVARGPIVTRNVFRPASAAAPVRECRRELPHAGDPIAMRDLSEVTSRRRQNVRPARSCSRLQRCDRLIAAAHLAHAIPDQNNFLEMKIADDMPRIR